jgi:hypothetical protein
MFETTESNDRDTKFHNVVDAALQLTPIPQVDGTNSSCTGNASVSPPHFEGVGGSCSGAGASDGWVDCGSEVEVTTGLADAATGVAETAGSTVIEVISGLLPF